MCGIVGIYLKTKKYEKHLGKFLSGMLDGMATRVLIVQDLQFTQKKIKIFLNILFVLTILKKKISKQKFQNLLRK